MSVSGELSVGLIRCTGRYDNISFIIETPFVHELLNYISRNTKQFYILYIEKIFKKVKSECTIIENLCKHYELSAFFCFDSH